MTELTENEIREIYGDKTFFKGQNYYDGGHVLRPAKVENTLYAQVLGSAAMPYEVRAYIDDNNMRTECSCPVGNMCKHGVALLLQWINDPSSFIFILAPPISRYGIAVPCMTIATPIPRRRWGCPAPRRQAGLPNF